MKKRLITYSIHLSLLASLSLSSTGCAAMLAINGGHTHQTKPEVKKENARIIGDGVGGYISYIDFKEGVVKINPYTYQTQEFDNVTRQATYRPFNGWLVFGAAWYDLLAAAATGWLLYHFWDITKTGPTAAERGEVAAITAVVTAGSLIAADLVVNGALAIPIPKELERTKQNENINQKQVPLKELTLFNTYPKWEQTIKVPEKGFFDVNLKDFPVEFFENPKSFAIKLSEFNSGSLHVSQDQADSLYLYRSNQVDLAETLELAYKKEYQKAIELAERVTTYKYLTFEEANKLSMELAQWYKNVYLPIEASYKIARTIKDFDAVISSSKTISTQSPYFSQAQTLIKEAENQKQQLNIFNSAVEQARQNNYISAYQKLRQIKNGVAFDSAKPLLSTYQSKAKEQESKARFNKEINDAYSLASQKQFAQAISIASKIQKDSPHYSKAQSKIKEWTKLKQLADAQFAAKARINNELNDIQKNKISVNIKGKNKYHYYDYNETYYEIKDNKIRERKKFGEGYQRINDLGGEHNITVVNTSNRAIKFGILVKSWANQQIYNDLWSIFTTDRSSYYDVCRIYLHMKPKEKKVVTCFYPKARFHDNNIYTVDFTKSKWEFYEGVSLNPSNQSNHYIQKFIKER